MRAGVVLTHSKWVERGLRECGTERSGGRAVFLADLLRKEKSLNYNSGKRTA